MEQQIAQLFENILHPTSNEEIGAAHEALIQLAETEDFYTSLFSLISQSTEVSIQKLGIITVTRVFEAEKIPPELKPGCLQLFIQAFPSLSGETIRSSEKFIDVVAKDFISAGEIESFVENSNFGALIENAELHLLAIMVGKSMAKLLKNKGDGKVEFFTYFVTTIFTPLCAALKGSNPAILQMLYHCASRVFNVPYQFVKNIKNDVFENFFAPNAEILQQAGLELLSDATFISEPANVAANPKLAVEVLKFLSAFTMFAKDSLNEEILQVLLAAMRAVFSVDTTTNVTGKALELLYTVYNRVGYEGILEENIEYFVGEVFPKFYVLTPDEVEWMETDPAAVVANIDKTCSDWSDPRASVKLIVASATKRHSATIISTFFQYISSVLEAPESSAQVFSAMHMFSSIIYRNDCEEFGQILPTIVSLCDNEDFIIRAAAFNVLSNAIGSQQVVDALEVCLQHIGDEAHIVSYYAALSIAFMFDTIKRANKRDEYLPQLQESAADIISAFLTIGEEFNDDNIKNSIDSIIDFFGSAIAPYASDISDNLIKKYMDEFNEGESDIAGSSLNILAVETLINTLKNNAEYDPILLHIFETLIEVTDQLSERGIDISDTFRALSKVVEAMTTLNPECWVILQHIIPVFEKDEIISLDDVEHLLGNLIAKDAQIGENEVLQQLLTFIAGCVEREEDSLPAALHLVSGLCVKIPNPEFLQLLPPFVQFIAGYLEENEGELSYDSGVDTFVSAIIYQYGIEALLQLFGEIPILEAWASQDEFPFLQKALIKNLEVLVQANGEVAVQALASSIRAVYDQINAPNDDDLFDFEDHQEEEGGEEQNEDIDIDLMYKNDAIGSNVSDVQYFSHAAVMREFHTFLLGIQSSEIFAGAAQILQGQEEEEGKNYLSCIDSMEEYAAKIEQL